MDDTHPARPTRRRRWPWLVGALLLALVLFLLLFDANWFRGSVERRVTGTTGREFSIGDLELGFAGWFRPELTARDVRLRNWPEQAPEQMFTAESIRLQPQVMPLFAGRIALRVGWLTAKKACCTENRPSRNQTPKPSIPPTAACSQNRPLVMIRPQVVISRMVRRSKTSASAPPQSPKTTSGTSPNSPVSPTQAEEPVIA